MLSVYYSEKIQIKISKEKKHEGQESRRHKALAPLVIFQYSHMEVLNCLKTMCDKCKVLTNQEGSPEPWSLGFCLFFFPFRGWGCQSPRHGVTTTQFSALTEIRLIKLAAGLRWIKACTHHKSHG